VAAESAKQLVLCEEPLPGYLPRELSFFAALAFCP
jgi:hypothetical protein